jgi:hypothetical protein
MVARTRTSQQLDKQQQQQQFEPADAAAAAAVAKDDAQLDDVITGCIGMLVTVHKLTSPPAADDQQQQQQGAASIDAALEAALQLLKPKVAANSQAYADIVSSVGRLKAQLARAH